EEAGQHRERQRLARRVFARWTGRVAHCFCGCLAGSFGLAEVDWTAGFAVPAMPACTVRGVSVFFASAFFGSLFDGATFAVSVLAGVFFFCAAFGASRIVTISTSGCFEGSPV